LQREMQNNQTPISAVGSPPSKYIGQAVGFSRYKKKVMNLQSILLSLPTFQKKKTFQVLLDLLLRRKRIYLQSLRVSLTVLQKKNTSRVMLDLLLWRNWMHLQLLHASLPTYQKKKTNRVLPDLML